MKIRWTADSVRFRITPSELETLRQGGTVREEFRVGNAGGWRAAITVGKAETTLYQDDQETGILLSDADSARLVVPETEGVYFRREGERPLRYFIEKDFPCIHPSASAAAETPTETFAAPSDFEQRKSAC